MSDLRTEGNMRIIQHTCDYCGFYYEEKAPAGYVLDKGMVEVANKHMCLDCQNKTNRLLKEQIENEQIDKRKIIIKKHENFKSY